MWELIDEQEELTSIDTWELVDTSESMNLPEPKISSTSEIASDDFPPELNNETTIGNSVVSSSRCHETFQLLGIVRERVNSFERKIDKRRMNSMKHVLLASMYQQGHRRIAEKRRVVFYFTSLTCISSTQEDCQDARRILQGYGVCLDERDVSIDARLKEQLNELLGMNFGGKLPRVFVDEYYIGGAEEMRKLHLSGELEYILQGCEMKAELCPGCDNERFLPCLSCSGSCRVYLESIEEDENSARFEWCRDCNEYGLIWCPLCW
jgi:glutaredoxin